MTNEAPAPAPDLTVGTPAPQAEEMGQAHGDIRILLAQIEFLQDLTGEKLEGEDAALVAQIAAAYPALAATEGLANV